MPKRNAAASTLIIILAHNRNILTVEVKIIQAYFQAASLVQLLTYINVLRMSMSSCAL